MSWTIRGAQRTGRDRAAVRSMIGSGGCSGQLANAGPADDFDAVPATGVSSSGRAEDQTRKRVRDVVDSGNSGADGVPFNGGRRH